MSAFNVGDRVTWVDPEPGQPTRTATVTRGGRDDEAIWIDLDDGGQAEVLAEELTGMFTVEGAAIATAFGDAVQIDHLTDGQLDQVADITKNGV
jgi:hypothetical protein